MIKKQTAFEQNLRLLAARLDQGYPLTPELKTAIAAVVSAAARSARKELIDEMRAFREEPECRAARHGRDSTCTCEDSRDE